MNLPKLVRQARAGVDMVRRADHVLAMPYHLLVGTCTACPLNCIMCSRTSVIDKASWLHFEEYQKLIDTIRPLQVSIGDLGESLFDPDLVSKIRYTKSRAAVIDVVTSYAVSRFSQQELIESGLDVLKVSIDGATAATYESIRQQPYLETAVENTQRLVQLRDKLGHRTPSVRLQFVVQKANFREIVDYVNLAVQIGADGIDYHLLLLDLPLQDREKLIGHLMPDDVYSLLRQADHLARLHKIQTNVRVLTHSLLQHQWDIYSGASSKPRDLRRCMLPWYSTYVAADGGVYGCCFLRFRGDEVLGNIYESDFASIWNGKAYREFRDEMSRGQSPFRTCYSCYPLSLVDTFKYIASTPKLRLFAPRHRI